MNKLVLIHEADRIMRRKLILRIVLISLSSVSAILLTIFLTLSAVDNDGVFEINALHSEMGNISLCDTFDFSAPTTCIKAESISGMQNISGMLDIPDDVDLVDGPHNGDDYFAHTFYLKNVNDFLIDVKYSFKIPAAFRGCDKAMRVRIYKDGVPVTYAAMGADGEPEFGTVPFMADDIVVEERLTDIKPDEIIKFTIVIWLEGDDPECVSDIQGGYTRFSMDLWTVEREKK